MTKYFLQTTKAAKKLVKLSGLAEANQDDPNTSQPGNNPTSSGVWVTLNGKGIKYKSLIALLYYLMDRGQKLEAGASERDLCLRATSLYFVLLALPGSGAFKIFHPVLYQKGLGTFKLATKLQIVRYSPKKKPAKRGKGAMSQASQRPRKRHHSRAGSNTSLQLVRKMTILLKD